jgi:hypothetical protein
VYRPKVREFGWANGQVESGFGADAPDAGSGDGGRTHPIKARSTVMRTLQSHTAQENPPSRSPLEVLRLPVQAKLAAAWTSLMFFVIYIDYFHLYQPGAIDQIRGGGVYEFDITPTLVTIFLVVIGIPALMVMLSMTLPGRVNRATNVIAASLYIPVMVFNAAGASSDWAFYYGLSIGVEVVLLAFIVRSAWTWPRRTASPATLAAGLNNEPPRTTQQA